MPVPILRPALMTIAAAGALTLAACGSSSSYSSTSTPSTAASTAAPAVSTAAPATSTGASTLPLSADPSGALKFAPAKLTAKAGAVTINMVNPSSTGAPHGVAVEGNGVDKDSKIIQPGEKTSLTVTLKPGTYSFYCPVPGHKQAGMIGVLTVT